MDHPVSPDASAAGSSGDAARKRELREFLMSRRARLKPADVGLPAVGRRRAPGLRREEVAQLAGVSTAWYTIFEMAKEARVSAKTLDAIAAALRLTGPETRHLAVLARGAAAVPPGTAGPTADSLLPAILAGFRAGPALLVDDRTDVLAMNDIAVAVFGGLSAATGYERNWLWLLAQGRLPVVDAREAIGRLAATFRASYCRRSTDPAFAALLDELLAMSDVFRDAWLRHDVASPDDSGTLRVRRPAGEEWRFSYRALSDDGSGAARLWFLLPDAATAAAPKYRALTSPS